MPRLPPTHCCSRSSWPEHIARPAPGPVRRVQLLGRVLAIAAKEQAPASKQALAERLDEARRRTWLLVDPLSDEQLQKVYSPLLSPLVWDLGHIGNFEELWLVQTIGDRPPLDGELGSLYNAIETPRSERGELPILDPAECRAYLAEVRARTFEVLDGVELNSDDPLLRNGFVYEMLIAHEHQHNETMMQLLQMIDGYERPGRDPEITARPAGGGPDMVEVPAGRYGIGTEPGGFAYDNERPRHEVELDGFKIDRTPVVSGEFAEFIAATDGDPPMYWERDGEGGWVHTAFGLGEPIDPDLPVIHVDHDQACAFARWCDKRLPTEFEWEAAAWGSDPAQSNLDGLAYGCAPAGSLPESASDFGAEQMLGDVWEWTSSDFRAYPGFEAFPYDEYSKVFFGEEYKVLRGGSWATRRNVLRVGFRNWDYPIRKQIFSGFRCARSI